MFTGSGSEADQLAIGSAVLAGLRTAPGATPQVITQVTEHPAVLACCEALERWHGARVTRPACAAALLRWIHVVITRQVAWDPAIAAGGTLLGQAA